MRDDGDRLERILARGVLRIGTTGDNAPFSTMNAAGEFDGTDVELSRSLCAALGVKPQYFRTSWPTVMQDLHADQYDIAMSGVVFSTERARTATFATPHVNSKKCYLIRSADKERFRTNKDVDSAGVRVGTNNGGTNEKYLRENIRNATVSTVLGRNFEEQLIAQLLSDRLDAWLVDEPPGLVVARNDSRLLLMDEPAQKISYGFLLHQQDLRLLNFVNLWLLELTNTGTLDEMRRKVLHRPQAR